MYAMMVHMIIQKRIAVLAGRWRLLRLDAVAALARSSIAFVMPVHD